MIKLLLQGKRVFGGAVEGGSFEGREMPAGGRGSQLGSAGFRRSGFSGLHQRVQLQKLFRAQKM